MIPAVEAARAINAHRGDAVVVAATAALRAWSSVSHRRELDVDLSDCMDKAPSVGLGISLAQNRRRVLVLDCDTVLRANLGSLVTVGNAAPANLVHFLFEDVTHRATGGTPIPGQERVNFAAMAQGAGYGKTFAFDNLEELVLSLHEVMDAPGPTFVSLKVSHYPEMPDYPDRSMDESMATVRRTLKAESATD